MQPDTLPSRRSLGDLPDPPYRGNRPLRLIPEVLSRQAYRPEPRHQYQEDLWVDRVQHQVGMTQQS